MQSIKYLLAPGQNRVQKPFIAIYIFIFNSYLCNSKVKSNVDDDSEEEDVESADHQQGLLQHQDLVEVIVNLF